jgi:signal transduction histidine kinase
MILTVAVILLSLVNFLLGVSAILRSQGSKTNRKFARFAFVTSIWMTANYVGANFKSHLFAKYFVQVDFLFGPWITYTVWAFTSNLATLAKPKSANFQAKISKIILAIIAVMSVISLTSLVKTLSFEADQRLVIKYGPLFEVYGVVIMLGVILALVNVLHAQKNTSGRLRSQINALSFGLVVFTLLLATANLAVPMITSSTRVNLLAGNLAYLGIVTFVAVSFYSIVKHRLFDIRLTIVRTIGFLVTILVVAGIYTLFVLGVSSLLIAPGGSQLLVLIPSTIFVGFTFHPILSFIANVTHHIFYQDTYDLKTTLDKISDTLITDNDIGKIMSQSLRVISDAIKPSYAYLAVFDENKKMYRELSLKSKITDETIFELIKYIKSVDINPMVTDDFYDKKLPDYFAEDNIALLLRLGTKDDVVGILVFGTKQNGRTYSTDDIALLRISSKNLGIALDNAKKYAQINQFAETMHQEVLKATAKLRSANEQLKTLDVMKDDFISMASHQLRTPASSVHEALQMLNHPTMPLNKEDKSRLIDLAEASSEHMATVVADMLSISRIQAGHFAINKSAINMVDLISRVLKQVAVLAEQKQIKLVFDKPKDEVKIMADQAKINEAVSNYIENAIKYSGDATTVTVRLATAKDRVIFEATDQGMGVPENERANLFGKFFRAGNARLEQPDGNGIGLFVVKSIATGHGGDTYYKPLDNGSTFGFWIPQVLV